MFMKRMKRFRQSATATLVFAVLLAASLANAGMEISEFMAKNDTTWATAGGAYEDWIEIHNDSGSAVDLAGWYLTDDPSDLRKWQFPSTSGTSPLAAAGYLIVFASGSEDSVVGGELHAGFKLGASGEYLALVDDDGETVVHQYNPEYPEQSADVSYGIDPASGASTYFASATPGSVNGQGIADMVQFSLKSQTFTSPLTVSLSVSSPTASVRYTLDGSVPTASSTLYGQDLSISTTTRVRARTFDSGLADGPVASETFIHLAPDAAAFSSEIPLVVIDTFGGGDIPDPNSVSRQPGHVMFFESVNGVCHLANSPSTDSRAGIRRRGESSLRSTADKPNLSLETWGEIDEDDLSIEPLGLPAESDWILFAPWQFDRALMRNSFIYEVSNEAGRYAVQTRFVEVFLNHDGGSVSASDYYGVYVLMEKIKRGSDRVDIDELPASAAVEPEITGGYMWKLDKFEAGVDPVFVAAGKNLQNVYPKDTNITATQQQWLTDCINEADAAVPNGNYGSFMDAESFADHHILNVFAQNADGLQASTFFFKDREGLIEMGPIWDFDRSMGCDNDSRPEDPTDWSFSTDEYFFFHSGGPLWFRALALNDAEFWMVWTDRWQAMRNGPLSDAAIAGRIEGYRTELSQAAIRNFNRWNNIPSSGWTGKVDHLKNHLLTRAQWIDDKLIDPPVLSLESGLVSSGTPLSMTGLHTTYYTLDGSDPRAAGGASAGTAYTAPITITGNTLVKTRIWNGAGFTQAPFSWPWSALVEAVFIVDPAPLAITEIMYHPRPPEGAGELAYTTSDFEFIEIQNTSGSSCGLVGVQFLDGLDFDFTYGAGSTLGAGAHGVVVRNLEAFKVRYSNWAGLNILGTYKGRLNDAGEELKLGYAPTNMLPLVSFDYEDDWYPCTDGEGFSLVLKDSQSAPSSWDSKLAWRYSAAVDGSPGMANPSLAYAPGSAVINELLSHQDTDNPGDWVELRNTTGSPIDMSGWFLSDSKGDLKKYTLPTGTVVPANGYVVLTEHDHFGAAFALSEHGDSVYLSAGAGGVLSEPAYREYVDFGGQERDVAFGRHVRTDGSADFPAMVSATMGTANAGPKVGPVIIEEIMYHPPTGGHEYIEIRNTSGSTVNLYDVSNPSNVWKVSGIDFEFPPGVQLEAADSLLLVRNTIDPALFRTSYQVPASIEIYNYSGALDNDADTVVLKKPGTPEAGTGYVPYIVVEQVKYNDDDPWPPTADGLGKALGRLGSSSYANDYANWQAVNAAYAPLVFTLVVRSGSGSGEYPPGSVVPIQAGSATGGQIFFEWIGNTAGIADTGAAAASITMPASDTTITASYTTTNIVYMAQGSAWKYHDQGQNLGTAWQAAGYDDASWPSGDAQLGYGDGDEATVVSFGGVAANKHITTYFRQDFSVDQASWTKSLTLELLRDDGAVVYINGVEVARDNMPIGSVDYQTPAAVPIAGGDENTFYSFDLSPSMLVDGVNEIAVEIHQATPGSSDLSFDASLRGLEGSMVFADGDDDGIYDSWEIDYFGSTENCGPGEDSDGDGYSNLDEFVVGSHPGVASVFEIEGMVSSTLTLTWTAVDGRIYSVWWSDDLQKSFTQVASGLTEGSYTTQQTNHVNYYRLKVKMD